jgi:hypothetical protein
MGLLEREDSLAQLRDLILATKDGQGLLPRTRSSTRAGMPVALGLLDVQDGSDVLASSYRIVVTPSGHVLATSTYPAEASSSRTEPEQHPMQIAP